MKTRLESINLLAKRPGKLRDFYVNGLGLAELEKISKPPGFFMINGNGCNITIQDADAVGSQPGKAGIEIGIESDNLIELSRSIVSHGGKIINDSQQMGWGEAFTAEDPEGHVINAYNFKK